MLKALQASRTCQLWCYSCIYPEVKTVGKNTDRPQLEALLKYVRDGDTIVVHSLDRLARNLDDLRRLVQTINAKDIKCM